MDERKDVVRDDFVESLDRIDFSEAYNPLSSDYDKALRLGLMWMLMCKMGGEEGAAGKVADVPADDISTLISSAKRLLQKSIDTGDSSYKGMAEESLKIAGNLVKKAYARLPAGEEKARLKSNETEISELYAQMN